MFWLYKQLASLTWNMLYFSFSGDLQTVVECLIQSGDLYWHLRSIILWFYILENFSKRNDYFLNQLDVVFDGVSNEDTQIVGYHLNPESAWENPMWEHRNKNKCWLSCLSTPKAKHNNSVILLLVSSSTLE